MAEKKHKLITVILNKGFADDAMAAARKVGAGGGTIIHARGTAKEEDVSFMGIKLVPEKETLMILVEKEKTEQVIQAIRDLPCLKEPGSGIIYSQDVDSFTGLGHQAEK
ncbi:MAG: P-II family nitrogen regulator [Spirochaetaceae bacterium]|nr:P-II family nitrogen regulator [Spirochaetaceae bacterium]